MSFSKNIEKPGWPQTAIITFTLVEFEIVRKLMGPYNEKKTHMGFIRTLVGEKMILVGPMVGAPLTILVMERLAAMGMKTFISIGSCGSLDPSLKIGDVFLPVTALSEEGTSAHYPLDAGEPEADIRLIERLSDALTARDVAHKKGRVWTTDAPYRETKEKIIQHAADGVMAVDMEASALMTVACFHELAWAGVMVVSDELEPDDHRMGFGSPELLEGLKKSAGSIMDLLENKLI